MLIETYIVMLNQSFYTDKAWTCPILLGVLRVLSVELVSSICYNILPECCGLKGVLVLDGCKWKQLNITNETHCASFLIWWQKHKMMNLTNTHTCQAGNPQITHLPVHWNERGQRWRPCGSESFHWFFILKLSIGSITMLSTDWLKIL